MAGILAGITVFLAIIVWAPIMLSSQPMKILQHARLLRASVALFSINIVLQFVFIILVGAGLLTLSYSISFAMIGVPACLLALAAAFSTRAVTARTAGVTAGGLGSLLLWGFLCTVH